jgi:hypothetical protein
MIPTLTIHKPLSFISITDHRRALDRGEEIEIELTPADFAEVFNIRYKFKPFVRISEGSFMGFLGDGRLALLQGMFHVFNLYVSETPCTDHLKDFLNGVLCSQELARGVIREKNWVEGGAPQGVPFSP